MREGLILWINHHFFLFLSMQNAARDTREINAVPPTTIPPQPEELLVLLDADVAEVWNAVVEVTPAVVDCVVVSVEAVVAEAVVSVTTGSVTTGVSFSIASVLVSPQGQVKVFTPSASTVGSTVMTP